MDKTIEALTRAYQEVVEKKKLDPVDNKELEKDFDDRDDQDIDNDGDVDKSDKYLHKRRKTVKKAIKKSNEDEPDGESGETAVMNPKGEQKEGVKESMTIRDKLLSVLEKRDDHYKGAAPAEPMDNNLKGEGAKKMKSDLEKGAEVSDTVSKGHDDTTKAGRVTKKSKANPTDKDVKGDMNVINKPVDITQQGGVKESLTKTMKSIVDSYQSMYEKKSELDKDIEKIAKDVKKSTSVDEDYYAMKDAERHAERDGKNYRGDVSVQHQYDAYHMKKHGYTHFEPGSYGTRRYTKGPTAHHSSTKIEPKHHPDVREETKDVNEAGYAGNYASSVSSYSREKDHERRYEKENPGKKWKDLPWGYKQSHSAHYDKNPA